MAAEAVLNFVGAGVVASEGMGETIVTVGDQGEGKMTEEQGVTLLAFLDNIETFTYLVVGLTAGVFVALLLGFLRR